MTPRPLSLRVVVCAAALAAVVSCGKSSPPVQPTPVDPPVITCGSAVSVQVERAPAVVEYAAPRVAGGAQPLTTSCTVPVGAEFPLGTTDVVCSTTDALQRRSQCVVQVTVAIAPRLQGTKFLAFGDSITEGEVSQPAILPRAVEPQNAYPAALLGFLKERYVLQASTIQVINEGLGGETVGGGEDRLVAAISRHNPDALLFLQGANDVNAGNLTESQIASGIRAGVNRAYRYGVKKVFLSTLLPQVPGRQKAYAREGVIEALNDEIRYIADREGAVLVDAFTAFDPQKELLIGIDGLHPTADGYRRLAELFRDAIKANFEVAPDPAPAPAPQGLLSRPARSR